MAVSSFLQRIANLVVQHRRGLLDRLAGQLRKRLFVLHLLRIEELVDALVGVLGVAVQAGEGFLDGLSCLCLLGLAVGDGDRAAAIALLVVPEALPSIGFCTLPAAEAMAVLARLPARFRLPASSVWAG